MLTYNNTKGKSRLVTMQLLPQITRWNIEQRSVKDLNDIIESVKTVLDYELPNYIAEM